jgi:5-(carboxyamino)imidazole ribonucleotide mutase
MNAGILAVQILASGDPELMKKVAEFKLNLAKKIEKANEEMAKIKFDFKVN